MKRTIRVTGKGNLKVQPDQIRILISLEDTFALYEEAVRESAKQTEEVKAVLCEAGLEKKSVKTLDFGVRPKYENYQYNDVWKKRLIGYTFSHEMKVEFDRDQELLGKVLEKLASCPRHPEFDIEYTIKDEEEAKSKLLEKAVKDSKRKAEILCGASDVRLGELVTIDYSWGEMRFLSETSNNICCRGADDRMMALGAVDIEPDDIDISDTVTVVWEIEDSI